MKIIKVDIISNEEINKAIKARISSLANTISCDQITSENIDSAVLGVSIRFNLFSNHHSLKMVIEYTYGCTSNATIIPPIFSMSIDGFDNKYLDFRSYLTNRHIEAPDNIIVNRNNISAYIFINNYFDWLESIIGDEIVPMFINHGWIEIPFDWGDR